MRFADNLVLFRKKNSRNEGAMFNRENVNNV